MEVVEFTIKGRHSIDLSVIKVEPKKAPKAVIQIFHGMGEYKERYIPFMEYLAENGYAVYAHDHRKHGKSLKGEADYGIFTKEDTWHDVIDDAYFVSRRIMKDFPGKEIYVMGHSMGSVIARGFLGEYPLVAKKAVIMGTPPYYTVTNAFHSVALAGFLKLVAPNKRSNLIANLLNKSMRRKDRENRTDFDWICSDEEVVDAYINDPLCGFAYTPKFYSEFFKAIINVSRSNFISLTKHIPILIISGDADPVGSNGQGPKDIYDQFTGHGYTQLTLELVKGAHHELLNEPDKLTTFEFIKNWFDTAE